MFFSKCKRVKEKTKPDETITPEHAEIVNTFKQTMKNIEQKLQEIDLKNIPLTETFTLEEWQTANCLLKEIDSKLTEQHTILKDAELAVFESITKDSGAKQKVLAQVDDEYKKVYAQWDKCAESVRQAIRELNSPENCIYSNEKISLRSRANPSFIKTV